MPIIEITVRGKVASRKADTVPYIVSGNSDYELKFDFDAEWAEYGAKTARFVYGGGYTDVVFDGNVCPVPVMNCGGVCEIGVYAGDIRTSTAASLPILGSVTLGGVPNEAPTPNVYNEIMERLNKLDGSGIDAKADVGDTIVVKSIDKDGKASEFEAAEYQPRTHYVDKNGEVHKLDNKFIDAEWMATGGIGEGDIVVFPKQTLSSGVIQRRQYDLQAGLEYAVTIDGVMYPCVAHNKGTRSVYLGNPTIADSSSTLSHNNEPFYILWAGGTATSAMFFNDSSLEFPLSVKVTDLSHDVPQKLPEKFLPTGIVKSVNGVKPDENGNVNVSGVSGGMSGGSIDVVANVGQTIVVKEVDASGKPTAWEATDLQERTHYAVRGIQPILANTSFAFDSSGQSVITSSLDIEAGKTYIVFWDGDEYVADCKNGWYMGYPIVYLGNDIIMNGMNSGEPFIFGKVIANGYSIAACLQSGSTHTVAIYPTDVTKIPNRFMPENSMPYYFEITQAESSDGSDVYYISEDADNLRCIYASGRELVAKYSYNGAVIYLRLEAYGDIDTSSFQVVFSNYLYRFHILVSGDLGARNVAVSKL